MKHWKDMNKFEKIEAVRSVHYDGIQSEQVAKQIPGSTRCAIIALYKRNRRALQDKPLHKTGKGVGSGGQCDPKISADQMGELIKLRQEGKTLEQMANIMGVGMSSIRRAFIRHNEPLNPVKKSGSVSLSVGNISSRPEGWKVRITDEPETLTAALCGDPTPQRRQLMAQGVI